MLIFIFKPLKWFTKRNNAEKALILGILGLLGYSTFFCLDYFWQIRPENLFGKLCREGLCLLLSLSALYIFFVGMVQCWKERWECWCKWSNDFQVVALITGVSGLLGLGALAKVSWTALTFWGVIDMPVTDFWYALIPGAFFLAIGLITLIIKVLWKVVGHIGEYISDQWHRA